MKYTRHIGDGYCATFKGILDLNSYDVPVGKLEWYLHVKKELDHDAGNWKQKIRDKKTINRYIN